MDYTASFDGLHREVVEGVTTGLVASVKERLASDGIARAFSIREEFPAQYSRLVAGELVEMEITPDHLPFFLRPASAKGTSLAFTGMPEDASGIGAGELNGGSAGVPMEDERIGRLSLPLALSGAPPWKLKLRVAGVPADTRVWLLFQLGIS